MVSVLDRLEEAKKIDKSDALGLCVKTPNYCEEAIHLAKRIHIPRVVNVTKRISIQYKQLEKIIIAGMGGSAIGGEILQDWLRDELRTPIEVCRDYTLPAYADEDTLVFAVSYSGNTEETLSAFIDAVKRRCMVISITSGGRLKSFSEKLQLPCVEIPKGLAPRTAVPYIFFPLPIFMEKIGVPLDIEENVRETKKVLEKLNEEIAPQIPTAGNPSKTLALELRDTIPVIYGFRQYKAIARRMKDEFNENSKILGIHDVFPELNHNDVVGWEASEKITKQFSVILIRDKDEPPEIRHRIEATKMLTLHKARKVFEIHARGGGNLAKMFSVMYFGDLTSLYLAILLGIDPTPASSIDRLKMEMAKRLNTVERLDLEVQRIIENKT